MSSVPPFYNHREGNSVGQLGMVNEIDGNLNGVQLGLVNYVEEDIKGIQVALGNRSMDIDGVQVGILNFSYGFVRGAQVGLLGNANEGIKGVQLTLLYNFNEGDTSKYQNNPQWEKDAGRGLQMAALFNKVDGYFRGLQVGAINISDTYLRGLQLGVICVAPEGSYLQLGVLTYRPGKNKWYKKFSPLIGFSKGLEDRV